MLRFIEKLVVRTVAMPHLLIELRLVLFHQLD